jgi:hypothetical protein
MDDQHQRQIAHVYWAEQLREDTMAVVCAVVRTSTGSLESAASVLEWAYFYPGPHSLTDEEWDALAKLGDPTATLELWVEKNTERIERARRSVFFAAVARGVLMDEAVMESNPEEED